VASAFGLSFYPNPARGSRNVTFHLEQPSVVALNILDLQGRNLQSLVKSQFEAGIHSVVFSDEKLSSGIYFLEMITPAGKKAVRFIVK
jgi:hypothetical protein